MRAKHRRPKTIPPWVVLPRSVVECVGDSRRTRAYTADVGHCFRIGYYGSCRGVQLFPLSTIVLRELHRLQQPWRLRPGQ
jgi:hypothetical protein